jgi:hypothetical protein
VGGFRQAFVWADEAVAYGNRGAGHRATYDDHAPSLAKTFQRDCNFTFFRGGRKT